MKETRQIIGNGFPVGKVAEGSVANRASFMLPPDGWIMALPKGSFPGVMQTREGEKTTFTEIEQVLDDAAIDAMLRDFQKAKDDPNFGGLLVDLDHLSHRSDSKSEAAGWVHEMERRADGLWVRPRWTEMGLPLVEGGTYRFVSPVLCDLEDLGGNKFRPARFERLALTNDPKLKGMPPITNRQETRTTENKMDTKKLLCSLLGLPETASDEEISQAVGPASARLKAAVESANKCGELKNRVTELQTSLDAANATKAELLATVVEYDATRFGAYVANQDELKKKLIANRNGTIEILTLLIEGDPDKAGKAAKHDVRNRNNPGKVDKDEQAGKHPTEAQSKAIMSRANDLMLKQHGMTFQRAVSLARSEIMVAN